MGIIKRSSLKKTIIEKRLSKSLVEGEFRKLANQIGGEQQFNVFLSHSFLDAEEFLVLSEKIKETGASVYIDWEVDPQLDRKKENKATARKLRERMENCDCLFFATSQNSSSSIWMPWELGYFDGKNEKVAILPISEDESPSTDDFKGQEYLGLYPYITFDCPKGKNKEVMWIHDSILEYVRFDSWLEGKKPYKR